MSMNILKLYSQMYMLGLTIPATVILLIIPAAT